MKKVESLRAQIISQKGRSVQLELIDELDIGEAVKRRYNGKYYAVLDIYDPDSVTDLQRKHYYALIGDYSEYTGVPLDASDAYFKYQFMIENDLDEFPSVGRGRMDKTTASVLLEYLITYFIHHDVPFRKQQFYLTTDASKMNFSLIMKRMCNVCGKPQSDIHHATNLVGIGNKRANHNHVDSTYLCLCREHHISAHSMGLEEFCQRHHLKPIKLTEENLKEIGVM